MSATSERMLKLMAYADGELDGAELAEVEGWIASDASAVRFANDLANLGDLVNVGHAASSDGKATLELDLADAIMAKIETTSSRGAAPEPEARPASIVSLSAARDRRQKKLKVAGASVFAALALAASVFVMTRAKEEQPMARAPSAPVQPAANANATGPGVDVDVAETPGHSVSVVYLPSENTLTTSVVVWVDETGDKK
jgi:anti-sigma factor RsiW